MEFVTVSCIQIGNGSCTCNCFVFKLHEFQREALFPTLSYWKKFYVKNTTEETAQENVMSL